MQEIMFSVESPELKIRKGHPADACWDLCANGDFKIPAVGRSSVHTGVRVAIPEGYAGFIWPRSGLSVHNGIDVLAGVIDSGYLGEIVVCLFNSSATPFEGKHGSRIAQIHFTKLPEIVLREGSLDYDPNRDGARGEAGFGSTGE